jgi:streptogramin lyase
MAVWQTNILTLVTVSLAAATTSPTMTAAPVVRTLVGTGDPGFSPSQVNNPFGLVIGPDGALYFCDVDNQRIRRFDFKTHILTTIAGNGERGFRGDGGPAVDAALNMPHEVRFDRRGDLYVAERDNHVIRRIDLAHGSIETVLGTGSRGNTDDADPRAVQLSRPHGVFAANGVLYVADSESHRIRAVR